MRKKIFIIHGKGVRDGIGRETGGDLDTIASNVFYTVWAKNALKEELLREPERGVDYDYDFINYSEGINHLAVHAGCDVYIPDFPVDALAPRLRLLLIKDPASIKLINDFTKKLTDFRMWIVRNSSSVGDGYKNVFNTTFNQVAKITDYKEVPVLEVANAVLDASRSLAESSVLPAGASDEVKERLGEAHESILEAFAGKKFASAKANILDYMNSDVKYDMSEIVEKKEEILAFDNAYNRDLSSRGRIGYTDELIILAAETVSYLVRGHEQLRSLPFDEGHAKIFASRVKSITGELSGLFSAVAEKVASARGIDSSADIKLNEALKSLEEAAEVIRGLENYRRPAKPEEKFPVTVMLTEEATGRAVADVNIIFERWKGAGKIMSADGAEIGSARAAVATDASGAASAVYVPASPEEVFQLNVTYDGLHVMLVPDELAGDTSASSGGDLPVEEDEEDKEAEFDTAADDSSQAQQVSLTLIERMFRFLKAGDVNVVSVDDHHPYTPEVLQLLNRLKGEGVIGNVHIHAAPRGADERDEDKKCGTDLIYESRIAGKRWDNDGLSFLRDMAHVQDLHLPKQFWPATVDERARSLAIELSKLIGSSFNKIEMTSRLAEIGSIEDVYNIMKDTGWDAKVKAYEDGLALVLPRTETNMVHLNFLRKPEGGDYSKNLLFADKIKKVFKSPKDPARKEAFLKKLYANNPANRLTIMAVLSPFTNAKLGETKINVASAINYLLYEKKYYADYFFYCYGSQIMTTRKPNDTDETINLSTLMQHIGTKADGGHKGAATCQPLSNPGFPKKRLLKVGDRNFIEFAYYIAGKVREYAPSLELVSVTPVSAGGYADSYEAALDKIDYGTVEYTFSRDGDDGTVKAVLTKAPRIAKNGSEDKPGITQILETAGRKYGSEYVFFLQGGMYSMVLYNIADPASRLDLPAIARSAGWDEDGGLPAIASATPKRNRRLPRDFRWLRDSDFMELSYRLASFINESSSPWKITKIKPCIIDGSRPQGRFVPPIATHIYRIKFMRGKKASVSMPESFSIIAVSAPFVDRKAGEFELPMTGVAAEIRKLGADYLVYLDWKKVHIVNISESGKILDCVRIAEVLTGRVSGVENLSSFERSLIDRLPGKFQKLYESNTIEFLKFFADRLANEFGYFSDWPVSIDAEALPKINYPLSKRKKQNNYRRAHKS